MVTGGGNGIGRACCVRFAAAGARVVVADLMTDAATETVQAVEDAGGEAVAVQLDASDQESNAAMMRTAVEIRRSTGETIPEAWLAVAEGPPPGP